MNNYYIVQTEENKEFIVQNALNSLNFKTLIPIEPVLFKINLKKYICSARLLPGYVFIEHPFLNEESIKSISKTKEVIKILGSKTSSGIKLDTLELNDIKKFIDKPSKYMERLKASLVDKYKKSVFHIVYGEYAGYHGKVKSFTQDNCILIEVDRRGPRLIKVPIWFIGYEDNGGNESV